MQSATSANDETVAPSDKKDAEKEGVTSVRFWLSQIADAKEAAKPANDDAKDAWEEYLAGAGKRSPDRDMNRPNPVRNPIYWSSVKNVQPMLYSRTPVVVAEKMFDDLDDNVARASCLCLERLGKYLIRACPFDRVMMAARDTFIHAGKVTVRVMFEADLTEKTERTYFVPVQIDGPPNPDGSPGEPQMVFMDDQGAPLPPETELQQDENGYFTETSEPDLDDVSVCPVPLNYREVLHNSDAAHWEEVVWIAFGEKMSKREFRRVFGDSLISELPFAPRKSEEMTTETNKKVPELFVTVWEIWDKYEEECLWVVEGYDEGFVKPLNYEGGDAYELDDFFPCAPFMTGTTGPDDLYPVPDYVQLRPLINQLHAVMQRIQVLSRALKRRGLADKDVEGIELLNDLTDETDFLLLSGLRKLVGEGGLESIVKFFPTKEYATALKEAFGLMQALEDKFNEIYGIPDIVRGVSDPNETAAAQQQKGRFLALRASQPAQEFQRLVRDTLEIMTDLALSKFPESKLIDIMGVRRMAPEEQQLWPQIIQLLRDDDERKVRIAIETDSTIAQSEVELIEQRNYLAETVFKGLTAISTAMQENPAFAGAAAELLKLVVRGIRGGKEVEEVLNGTLAKLIESAQSPQPDPEAMKAQAQVQAQQARGQADIQIENQKAQAEMVREKAQADHRMQLEQMQAGHDAQIAQIKGAIEIQKADHKMQLEAKAQGFDQELSKQIAIQEARTAVKESAAPAAPPPGESTHIHLAPETQIIAPKIGGL